MLNNISLFKFRTRLRLKRHKTRTSASCSTLAAAPAFYPTLSIRTARMNDLNSFSVSVYRELQNSFTELECIYDSEDGLLIAEFSCPGVTKMGGMIVQTTSDNSIWLRIHPDCSAYSPDSLDELIEIMKAVLNDRILWAVGHTGEEWVETTLVRQKSELERELGVRYQLYSWSGQFDEVLQG
jgi:hypothetical protein